MVYLGITQGILRLFLGCYLLNFSDFGRWGEGVPAFQISLFSQLNSSTGQEFSALYPSWGEILIVNHSARIFGSGDGNF